MSSATCWILNRNIRSSRSVESRAVVKEAAGNWPCRRTLNASGCSCSFLGARRRRGGGSGGRYWARAPCRRARRRCRTRARDWRARTWYWPRASASRTPEAGSAVSTTPDNGSGSCTRPSQARRRRRRGRRRRLVRVHQWQWQRQRGRRRARRVRLESNWKPLSTRN